MTPEYLKNIPVGLPFVFSIVLDTDDDGIGEDDNVKFVANGMLVQHVAIAIYDKSGAIVQTTAVRDEITLSIQAKSGETNWQNVASDVFALAEYSRSLAFKPFILPGGAQFKVTANVSSFVADGSPVGNVPYRVKIIFIGRKLSDELGIG